MNARCERSSRKRSRKGRSRCSFTASGNALTVLTTASRETSDSAKWFVVALVLHDAVELYVVSSSRRIWSSTSCFISVVTLEGLPQPTRLNIVPVCSYKLRHAHSATLQLLIAQQFCDCRRPVAFQVEEKDALLLVWASQLENDTSEKKTFGNRRPTVFSMGVRWWQNDYKTERFAPYNDHSLRTERKLLFDAYCSIHCE